jgi:hypothetical protein
MFQYILLASHGTEGAISAENMALRICASAGPASTILSSAVRYFITKGKQEIADISIWCWHISRLDPVFLRVFQQPFEK